MQEGHTAVNKDGMLQPDQIGDGYHTILISVKLPSI